MLTGILDDIITYMKKLNKIITRLLQIFGLKICFFEKSDKFFKFLIFPERFLQNCLITNIRKKINARSIKITNVMKVKQNIKIFNQYEQQKSCRLNWNTFFSSNSKLNNSNFFIFSRTVI